MNLRTEFDLMMNKNSKCCGTSSNTTKKTFSRENYSQYPDAGNYAVYRLDGSLHGCPYTLTNKNGITYDGLKDLPRGNYDTITRYNINSLDGFNTDYRQCNWDNDCNYECFGPIESIKIENSGTKYLYGTGAEIRFYDPSYQYGTGAELKVITDHTGEIVAINVVKPGVGYAGSSYTYIMFTYNGVPVPSDGSLGSGAVANIVIQSSPKPTWSKTNGWLAFPKETEGSSWNQKVEKTVSLNCYSDNIEKGMEYNQAINNCQTL
jgi:hypothetical protein